MRNRSSSKIAICIVVSFLSLFSHTTPLSTTTLAADSDEIVYAQTFEDARRGIRDGSISIIGGNSYPSNDISECKYTFYDIDQNGISELILTTEGGTAFIYTLDGTKNVLLAKWGGYRDHFEGINERGYMFGGGSSSASSGGISYVRIASDGISAEVTDVTYEYDYSYSLKYIITTPDGRKKEMSEADGESYKRTNLDAPLIELSGWKTLTDQSGKTTITNTPSEWAKGEVTSAISAGLVPENLQKNYQSSIPRGSVAQMFINLIEKSTGQSIEGFMEVKGVKINKNAFTDTNDEAVLAANALGIINGVGNGKFEPDGTLTRAHVAALLTRVANVVGVSTEGYTHSFTDVGGHWANLELGWPVHAGIINGVGGNRFEPDGPLTNEQVIAAVYRSLPSLAE